MIQQDIVAAVSEKARTKISALCGVQIFLLPIVIYSIEESDLPEGMEVTILPDKFTAQADCEYQSKMVILTSPELAHGSYIIPVKYRFEGFGHGQRIITYNVSE